MSEGSKIFFKLKIAETFKDDMPEINYYNIKDYENVLLLLKIEMHSNYMFGLKGFDKKKKYNEEELKKKIEKYNETREYYGQKFYYEITKSDIDDHNKKIIFYDDLILDLVKD